MGTPLPPTASQSTPSHRRRWFGGRPGVDTAVALVTLLGLWGGYYLTAGAGQWWGLALAVVVVGTAVPAWTIRRLRGSWPDLGITRHRLRTSLAVAAVLGGGSVVEALALANAAGVDPVTQLLANAVVLWEPLFFYGWLYLRWEKAFGIVGAVLLTGVGFALIHVGSVPPEVALSFGGFGLVFAAVFATTRNLAIMWPLFYPVASTIGTLQAGFVMGWGTVVEGAVLLVVQVVVLVVLLRGSARRASATSP